MNQPTPNQSPPEPDPLELAALLAADAAMLCAALCEDGDHHDQAVNDCWDAIAARLGALHDAIFEEAPADE